eukprot:gene3411-13454_t
MRMWLFTAALVRSTEFAGVRMMKGFGNPAPPGTAISMSQYLQDQKFLGVPVAGAGGGTPRAGGYPGVTP